MPSRFFATLKPQGVELGVTNAEGLAAMQARQAKVDEIEAAGLTQLREMAAARRIAFHPNAPAGRIRARLLRDV